MLNIMWGVYSKVPHDMITFGMIISNPQKYIDGVLNDFLQCRRHFGCAKIWVFFEGVFISVEDTILGSDSLLALITSHLVKNRNP